MRLLLVAIVAAASGCASKAAEPPAEAHAPVPGVVVDKVVAVVSGRPITLSEVELEARLSRAAAGDVKGAISGPIARDEMAAMLSEVVDRISVLRGLRPLYPDTVDPRAADLELERLRRAFSSTEEWQRFLSRIELTEEEVRERRRRALEASAIVDAKLSDVVQIESEALEEYMRKHGITDRRVAEARMIAERSDEFRRGVIADARRSTGARIVDPLTPQNVQRKSGGSQ